MNRLSHSSHGSWGGSSGGTSYTSYGSSGGGSYGSSGGGSYGGSSGGSSGGWSSYGTPVYESSEPIYEDGVIMDEAPAVETGDLGTESSGDALAPTPALDDSTSVPSDQGLLLVNLPTDAKLIVNGHTTKSRGDLRRFVSKGLKSGYRYPYEVKAVVERNGQELVETKTVRLRAGSAANLKFDFETEKSVETKLTVNLPEDAKVVLAGSSTTSTGAVRVFSTTTLADGAVWPNYTVQVSIDRNGQTLNKQQTIDLRGGESRDLTFDFDQEQVAAR